MSELASVTSTRQYLRRYMSFMQLVDLIVNKRMRFSDVSLWQDQNDIFSIAQYCKAMRFPEAEVLSAICFCRDGELIEFWDRYASGPDGVCIEINRVELESHLSKFGFKLSDVFYESSSSIRKRDYTVEDLPFMKRDIFRNEAEARIICRHNENEAPELNFDLNLIKRIYLAPNFPQYLQTPAKQLMNELGLPKTVRIHRTTANDSSRWKREISRIAGQGNQ